MYKIFLVDDESIVIEALTFIIENAFPEQCEMRSAKTGRAFIELAEQFNPDICFVDIQMPGINGLDAIKEVRKTNPNTIFLIVSAYNEFDYAKEAIDLGVMAYLNKPIEKEEITQNLTQAMQEVDARRLARARALQTQEKLEIVTPIIENGLIYQMTNEFGAKETLLSYLSMLSIEEPCGNFMVLQFGDEGDHGELTNAIGVSVRLEGLYDKAKKLIAATFRGVTGPLMGNTIPVFLPSGEAEDDEAALKRLRDEQLLKASGLAEELKKKLKVRLRIAFGAVHEVHDISASYKEATRALKYEAEEIVYAKKSDNAKGVIRKACDYIELNYASDLSLDEVALHAGVSPHYLSKLFKKETGTGFVDYLTDVRLKEARELLETSDKSVKEIGALVGYPDQNYFSRIFKKQMKVSPTDYKEGKREKT